MRRINMQCNNSALDQTCGTHEDANLGLMLEYLHILDPFECVI